MNKGSFLKIPHKSHFEPGLSVPVASTPTTQCLPLISLTINQFNISYRMMVSFSGISLTNCYHEKPTNLHNYSHQQEQRAHLANYANDELKMPN